MHTGHVFSWPTPSSLFLLQCFIYGVSSDLLISGCPVLSMACLTAEVYTLKYSFF
jgi:hypothetical protein